MLTTKRLLVPKKPFFTIFFISWMVFITLFSLFYFPDDGIPFITIPHMDKMVHFMFYFGASISASLCVREQTRGSKGFKKVLSSTAILSIIYGIIIEVLQETLTTYRDGNVYDVIANTVGSLFGITVLWYLFSVKRRFNWKN